MLYNYVLKLFSNTFKGEFIMKNIDLKKITALLLIFPMTLILFCSCGEYSGAEKTLDKLEDSINAQDIDGIVSCCEPNVQSIYNGISGIGKFFLGDKVDSLISSVGSFSQLFGGLNISDSLPEVKFKINSREKISDTKVKFNVTAKYKYSEEIKSKIPADAPEESTFDITFVKENDQWYISAS